MLTEHAQPAILAMSTAVARLARRAAGSGGCGGSQPWRVLGARGGRHVILRGCPAHGEAPWAIHAGGGAGRRRRNGRRSRPRCRGRHARVRGSGWGEVVTPANLNAPGQVVIAGHTAAVARAGERAKALGAKRVIRLAVSAPFHCALMKPAEDRLAPELRALTAAAPSIPVVANVDAQPKRTADEAIDALVRQVSSPVRWEDVVRRLIADGATTFVELGPGTVLAGLIKKIDRSAKVHSVEDDAGLSAAISSISAAPAASSRTSSV